MGMGMERVQFATFVGWPAPNWNDWMAEARHVFDEIHYAGMKRSVDSRIGPKWRSVL